MKIHRLVLAGLLIAAPFLAADPEIGKPAPDFNVNGACGNTFSLSDFEGKYVVLEWLNHECPFVVKFYNAGEMQRLQREHTENGGAWLVVNTSAPGKQGHLTAEQAQEVSEEKNAAHTALLLDHDGTMGRAYGARVTPHMYVIDPDGNLIYNGAIDSIRSANSDDIERAENYVLAAIEASKNGEEVANPVTRAYGCTVKY